MPKRKNDVTKKWVSTNAASKKFGARKKAAPKKAVSEKNSSDIRQMFANTDNTRLVSEWMKRMDTARLTPSKDVTGPARTIMRTQMNDQQELMVKHCGLEREDTLLSLTGSGSHGPTGTPKCDSPPTDPGTAPWKSNDEHTAEYALRLTQHKLQADKFTRHTRKMQQLLAMCD